MYDPMIGRFLQEDPIWPEDNVNPYGYVDNNPLTNTDPTGLYDEDVHFYMTYYIASAIGLGHMRTDDFKRNGKESNYAIVIAWANAYTDVHSSTAPIRVEVNDPVIKRKYHFRTSGEKVQADSAEAWAIVHDAFLCDPKKPDPMLLGIGLHAYQDSWSHEGYEPFYGHLADGHLPDAPWRDPKKALKMAEATYNELADYYAKIHDGAKPRKSFKEIQGTLKTLFERRGEEKGDPPDYDKDMAGRIAMWKAQIYDDFGTKPVFDSRDDKDPWAEAFLKAAAKVTDPKNTPAPTRK